MCAATFPIATILTIITIEITFNDAAYTCMNAGRVPAAPSELGASMRAPMGKNIKRAGFINFMPATAPDSEFRFPVYRDGKQDMASLAQVESIGPDAPSELGTPMIFSIFDLYG